MKKAKVISRKPAPVMPDSIELRRWCIENALRWPSEGGMAGVYQHVGRMEADVIGRAERLLAWVTKPRT